MMRMIITLVILIYALGNAVAFTNLQCNFTCTKPGNDSIKVITGSIRYEHPNRALIRTLQPQNQWILISKNEMTIYSIDNNSAYVLQAQSGITIPYLSDFMPAVMEDFGLSAVGFGIQNVLTFGDTLVTSWRHVKEKELQIAVHSCGDALLKIAYSASNGENLGRVIFSNHLTEAAYAFPCKVEVYDAQGKRVKITELTDVCVNDPLMPPVQFTFPPDAKIVKDEW